MVAVRSAAADYFYPPNPSFNMPSEFSTENPETSEQQASQTTVVLTPSNGSTCVSLYPRTMTFSFVKAIDDDSFLATSSDDVWRVTRDAEWVEMNHAGEGPRFTFEKLGESKDAEPLEVFKRCKVSVVGKGSRRSSRRLSIGDYESGFESGFCSGPAVFPIRGTVHAMGL